MFGDEASFWLDGTLHVTWSKVGVQPRVDTFGERKTAHVYGAVSIEPRPYFVYQFADVFNGSTFLDFLKELVRRCPRRKVFLIIDNGPCHCLEEDGQQWLADHRHRVELFRLPTYSPELNGIEGVWKVTKKNHHAQPLLPHRRRARRRLDRHVRDLQGLPGHDRRPRRAVPMIPLQREPV
jgi:hypothetical protein